MQFSYPKADSISTALKKEKQANDMFSRLVIELAEKEGITEALKESDQMEWVRRMNNIQARAGEIVNKELIFV